MEEYRKTFIKVPLYVYLESWLSTVLTNVLYECMHSLLSHELKKNVTVKGSNAHEDIILEVIQ